MRHWHRQFLGRTQLPPTLSALAISEFFTLNGGEIRAVLSRYGMEMRLGSALQIGFLKMCGRPLEQLQRVPIPVLEHLGGQIGGAPPEIATLRAIYGQRRRTLIRTPAIRTRHGRHDALRLHRRYATGVGRCMRSGSRRRGSR